MYNRLFALSVVKVAKTRLHRTRCGWYGSEGRSSVPASDLGKGKGGVRTPSNIYILVTHSPVFKPRGDLPHENGPKDAGHLHPTVHDATLAPWQDNRMRTPCPNCGKRVRTSVTSFGAFRVLVWSCEGEEITRCPRRGNKLIIGRPRGGWLSIAVSLARSSRAHCPNKVEISWDPPPFSRNGGFTRWG